MFFHTFHILIELSSTPLMRCGFEINDADKFDDDNIKLEQQVEDKLGRLSTCDINHGLDYLAPTEIRWIAGADIFYSSMENVCPKMEVAYTY